jgi:hypothetical protein
MLAFRRIKTHEPLITEGNVGAIHNHATSFDERPLQSIDTFCSAIPMDLPVPLPTHARRAKHANRLDLYLSEPEELAGTNTATRIRQPKRFEVK